MSDPVRVLIADDDALVRAGLRMMLDGAEQLAVVGEAADGSEVPRLLRAHPADVVLMDIRMPQVDGITATRRLRRQPDPPQVLILTTFDSDENVALALQAGAAGFLLKDAAPAVIVDAIHRTVAGEPTLAPAVLRRLLNGLTRDRTERSIARQRLHSLSPRELEVTAAVAEGLSNAQIAAELFMSVATAKAHVTSILTKLDLENRTQLALLAHSAELGQQS